MKNTYIYTVALFFLSFSAIAQEGFGTNSPAPSSVIDAVSNDKGVLLPRLALSSLIVAAPVTSPADALTVYNTSTAGIAPNNVTPGYYYWSTSLNRWVRLIDATDSVSNDWKVTGNAGTTAGTNFLGTTDNVDMVFKRSNVVAGVLKANNTSFGTSSLPTTATGINNSAFGSQALAATTSGFNNVAVGRSALAANTTGGSNVAVGYRALTANTTTSENIAIGNSTLAVNTTGDSNIAIGSSAMSTSTGGTSNIAIGKSAMSASTGGSSNIAIGSSAMNASTGGTSNIALGTSALATNTTGSGNVAIGSVALIANTTGNGNVAIGNSALTANTTGNFNSSMGYFCLSKNTLGEYNVAAGSSSLRENTSGVRNSAFGAFALRANTIGEYNTAMGSEALQQNIVGSQNTALGYNALEFSKGNYNTAVGTSSLSSMTAGNNNTAIGAEAGNMSNITGSNNTLVGYQANVPNGASSNQVRIGNTAVTYAGVQVAWTVTSDKRLKSNIKDSDLGLDFIKQLRPVSYIRKNDESKKLEYGFIAQEVKETLKNNGVTNSGIISEADDSTLSVRYNDLIAPMVKAFQEQQKVIEMQKNEIETLKKQSQEALERIKRLEEIILKQKN